MKEWSYVGIEVMEINGAVHEFPVISRGILSTDIWKSVERQCNIVVKGMCIGAIFEWNPIFTTCQGCDLSGGNLSVPQVPYL